MVSLNKTNNERIETVKTLLGYAPIQATDVLLDIGMGSGEISAALANRSSYVVGTGLNFASYAVRAADLQPRRILPIESICEQLPFAEGTFDGVVLSHILEHTPNVGVALSEVRRVLRVNGLLCVLVPPGEPVVAGGHISVGWNIGQLMYVLALNGFDTRRGNFVKYGYNVCAFVRKEERPLPALRHDFGDVRALANDGWWPVPLENADSGREAFNGDLSALNWPWTEIFKGSDSKSSGRGPVGRLLRFIVPRPLKPKLAVVFQRLAGALLVDLNLKESDTINPKRLGS